MCIRDRLSTQALTANFTRGSELKGCASLISPDFMRVPFPAANTTTHTSFIFPSLLSPLEASLSSILKLNLIKITRFVNLHLSRLKFHLFLQKPSEVF